MQKTFFFAYMRWFVHPFEKDIEKKRCFYCSFAFIGHMTHDHMTWYV